MKLGLLKPTVSVPSLIPGQPFEVHGELLNTSDRDGYLFYMVKRNTNKSGYMATSIYAHEKFTSYVGRAFESYTAKELKDFIIVDTKEMDLVENNTVLAKAVLERADDI